jgi:hypothetical protein
MPGLNSYDLIGKARDEQARHFAGEGLNGRRS